MYPLKCSYCGLVTETDDMFETSYCTCFCGDCGALIEDEDKEVGFDSLDAQLCFECQLIEAGE